MKTLASTLMISLSLIAGVAQAASSTDVPTSKTRAQVVAELQEARAQGLLSTGQEDYPIVNASTSSKTRAEVEAELVAAEAAGTISRGELDYPPVSANAKTSTTTRAAVEAEYTKLAGSGQLPSATF